MQILNAILHIIKNDGSPSVYSTSELDIDSEVCEAFIKKHVKKLWNNPATREATFLPESEVYKDLQAYMSRELSFKDFTTGLGERLNDIINQHKDIPPADLMVVRFDVKHDSFLAMFKLNYNECFTHKTGGTANNIIKCETVLPFTGGKVEEACLIPFSPMLVNLIEKAHIVDGEAKCYFSELFLECETALSRKETAQIIHEVSEEFVEEYFQNDIKTYATIKTALTEEAAEADGIVSLDNVAQRVFEDDEPKKNFIHTMREAGIIADLALGDKFVKQQFGTHRLKAENGVEIKFPAELAVDEGQMEIQQHSDGTVTVTLKRLRTV